jgi:hypothetical protein
MSCSDPFDYYLYNAPKIEKIRVGNFWEIRHKVFFLQHLTLGAKFLQQAQEQKMNLGVSQMRCHKFFKFSFLVLYYHSDAEFFIYFHSYMIINLVCFWRKCWAWQTWTRFTLRHLLILSSQSHAGHDHSSLQVRAPPGGGGGWSERPPSLR